MKMVERGMEMILLTPLSLAGAGGGFEEGRRRTLAGREDQDLFQDRSEREDGDADANADALGLGLGLGLPASPSSGNLRGSLASYLHDHLSISPPSPPHQHTHTSSSRPTHGHPRSTSTVSELPTPPSSFTQSVDIPAPNQPSSSSNYNNPQTHTATMSLPLTPTSSSSLSGSRGGSVKRNPSPGPASAKLTNNGQTRSRVKIDKHERQVISLISSIFPTQFATIAASSHTLEIVTPPSNILRGFILDHNSRTVFIHLPPPSASSEAAQRPETLSPNFSQVLRPHDPFMVLSTSPPSLSSSPTGSSSKSTTNYALDIRESLTALLDLASEALEASNLVLVLDREEREQEGLGELLHSLMYVGGHVIKPGAMEGGWEWDPMKWVLVGMEL
ncbi:hypothetical protein I316_07456 [Kwoniella heveanensis BCC8398]|uniref:Ornithine decarboxylase antizyme n=1 Tax=Kwoniella heveanensis BCC8398 TaxID=1296120 RepID=A0A1B9GIS5_9TREE|nr:hypothetical protein I316_07456 [Kwoniella heveanensis BCC8398]